MQNAGNYFNIAKDVANLVSQSLGKQNSQKKTEEEKNETSSTKSTLVDGFFRLLGLDSHKIIAIAVNSVIFLAQLVSECDSD